MSRQSCRTWKTQQTTLCISRTYLPSETFAAQHARTQKPNRLPRAGVQNAPTKGRLWDETDPFQVRSMRCASFFPGRRWPREASRGMSGEHLLGQRLPLEEACCSRSSFWFSNPRNSTPDINMACWKVNLLQSNAWEPHNICNKNSKRKLLRGAQSPLEQNLHWLLLTKLNHPKKT